MACPQSPKINLLKGSYNGKLGETVGYEVNGSAQVRSYVEPTDPKTEEQVKVRDTFSEMNEYVATFADEVKDKVTYDEKCRSTRNNIVKANKEQFKEKEFDPSTLLINKGNLPQVRTFKASVANNELDFSYSAPVSGNLTQDAQLAVLVVDKESRRSSTTIVDWNSGQGKIPLDWTPSNNLDVYHWTVDKRAHRKAGSDSEYDAVAVNQ